VLINVVLFHRVRFVWDATAIVWSMAHAADSRVEINTGWNTEVFAPL